MKRDIELLKIKKQNIAMENQDSSVIRKSPKRLLSLDILRGIAIMGMLFLHNVSFHYANINELLNQDPMPLFVTIIGFVLLWAGIFGFISGFANSYINVQRIEDIYSIESSLSDVEKEIKSKNINKKAVIAFLIMFSFHWIWTLVTGNSIVLQDGDDPELRTSIIIGLIYYGEIKPIHPEIYIFASSLWMIAINLLVVILLLNRLYKKYGADKWEKVRKILIILSVIILILTPILRWLLFPIMMNLVESGPLGIVGAIPIALLINDPNPVFPFLGYGLLGAVLGIDIVHKRSKKEINQFLFRFGIIWIFIGIIGVFSSGGIVISGRESIWGQDAIYYTSLAYLLLGLFCFFMIIVLGLFEYISPEKKEIREKKWNGIIRFGKLSLTIFIFEGILAYIIRIVIELFAPNWNTSLWNMLIFASLMIVLWYILSIFWEKISFKFSIEWFIQKLKHKK